MNPAFQAELDCFDCSRVERKNRQDSPGLQTYTRCELQTTVPSGCFTTRTPEVLNAAVYEACGRTRRVDNQAILWVSEFITTS